MENAAMRRIIFLFIFLLVLLNVNAKLSSLDQQYTGESYNKGVTLFKKLSDLSILISEKIYSSLDSIVVSFRKLSNLSSPSTQNNNTNFEAKVVSFRKLDRLNFTNQLHNSASSGFLVEVTNKFCKGTIQLQSIDSNLNPVPFTKVFFNNSLNGTTDIFGLFESKQRSVCGEMISYTLKCENNITCETKTTTLDFHRDFDSLSFDCSVCTGDIDLRLDMRNIKANKEDNKMAVNISMINVPATNDVNITFKVQGNDGLISKEESQLFNITSNDRFKFITQSIALSGNDFLHVYVDPNNEVTETNEKNNYVLIPLFEKQINAYLNISTGYENIDNKIKDYLKLFVNEKPKDEADVTIAVGLPNKNTIINNKNSLTKTNYKWWFDNRIYYNNMPLGSMPYNGLVGAFSDDYNYIFVAGNDIDGLIAAVKRLISARELFFSNLNKDKVSVIEDMDVSGISVADLLRNPSNFPYYEKRGTIMFANVVEKILEDNNFEVDIKTVRTTNDNTTLRLKNINTDFSDNFKDAVIGNLKPVVLARGLWSNLFAWEDFGKELAFDKNNARDTWLIEITGGPRQDCETCPNYEYEDLTDYYWPALITGVQNYSGQKTLDYVGFSNGCRVALSSLSNYSKTGKINAGYVFDSTTGNYILSNLGSNPVSTFIGVGCPGAFVGQSFFKEFFGNHGNAVNTTLYNKNHVTQREVAEKLALECSKETLSDDKKQCEYIAEKLAESDDDNKISRNLANDYLEFIKNNNDVQPVYNNLSVNKGYFVYSILTEIADKFEIPGNLVDFDQDGVVTSNDSIQMSNLLITSNSDKTKQYSNIGHSSLPNGKSIIKFIKEVLK